MNSFLKLILIRIKDFFTLATKEIDIKKEIDKVLVGKRNDVYLCSRENKLYAILRMIEYAQKKITIHNTKNHSEEKEILADSRIARAIGEVKKRKVAISYFENKEGFPSFIVADNITNVVLTENGKRKITNSSEVRDFFLLIR